MNYFWGKLRKFFRDESGPTTVEYAVMLMVIVLGVMSTLRLLGTATISTFETTSNGVRGVVE